MNGFEVVACLCAIFTLLWGIALSLCVAAAEARQFDSEDE